MNNLNYFNIRQIELVEFGEKVYHEGLRHTGINGCLYEDILIKYLRDDIPELTFYKGQIKSDNDTSPQYDIIICKKDTTQKEFLKGINPYINIVEKNDCLGVIELKKWAHPKMICNTGNINYSCKIFKEKYPDLKYLFVCFRFKDRKRKNNINWKICETDLIVDNKFCFWGNVYDDDKEWEFPWITNKFLLERNKNYLGQYEDFIDYIKSLA